MHRLGLWHRKFYNLLLYRPSFISRLSRAEGPQGPHRRDLGGGLFFPPRPVPECVNPPPPFPLSPWTLLPRLPSVCPSQDLPSVWALEAGKRWAEGIRVPRPWLGEAAPQPEGPDVALKGSQHPPPPQGAVVPSWGHRAHGSLQTSGLTHSIILAWRIPWTEQPGRLQSIGSQRVRCN